MSAISDSLFRPVVSYETKWDEVFIVATRPNSLTSAPSWRPAVNAYRCSDQFVIFVDLAGVPPESVDITAQARRLVIHGRRPVPEPGCRRSELVQLLALEIDQGEFERVFDLPQDIEPRGITTDYRDGLLQIRLPLAA